MKKTILLVLGIALLTSCGLEKNSLLEIEKIKAPLETPLIEIYDDEKKIESSTKKEEVNENISKIDLEEKNIIKSLPSPTPTVTISPIIVYVPVSNPTPSPIIFNNPTPISTPLPSNNPVINNVNLNIVNNQNNNPKTPINIETLSPSPSSTAFTAPSTISTPEPTPIPTVTPIPSLTPIPINLDSFQKSKYLTSGIIKPNIRFEFNTWSGYGNDDSASDIIYAQQYSEYNISCNTDCKIKLKGSLNKEGEITNSEILILQNGTEIFRGVTGLPPEILDIPYDPNVYVLRKNLNWNMFEFNIKKTSFLENIKIYNLTKHGYIILDWAEITESN